MVDVVIVSGARTPQGRIKGQLASLSAVELGTIALRAAIERSGIPASDIDAVIFGQVLQAGAGQNPARQTAIGAGVGWNTPATTINKVCLSGLEAVIDAARLIRAGEAQVVAAGGQESMTNAPHVLPGSQARLELRHDVRAGHRSARRPHRRIRPRFHGRLDRAIQHASSASTAPNRTRSPPGPTRGPQRRRRPGCSTWKSRRSPSRTARESRRFSPPTRASARTARPSPWPDYGPRSPRAARSRPATPRR